MMKKVMSMLLMVITMTAVATLTSCSDDDNENVTLSKFTIDPTATTLTPGETLEVKTQFFPENVDNKNVTWTSSDNEVATVSNGVVTALKPGNATITATPEAMPQLAQTLSINVVNNAMTAEGEVSGTWKAYTTVTVTGQVKVPEGKSLTIEEGVEIIFNSSDAKGTGIELTVDGNI